MYDFFCPNCEDQGSYPCPDCDNGWVPAFCGDDLCVPECMNHIKPCSPTPCATCKGEGELACQCAMEGSKR